MHRFFYPEELIQGSECALSAEESHHLAKVVRILEGERIELVNGEGALAEATVVRVSGKECRAKVGTVTEVGGRPRLHLAFAVPKSTAFDFIVRRCTEVGVAGFQPLLTDFSLRPESWNETRWRKVVVEVCKQCEETYFPRLPAPVPLERWLEARPRGRTLVFCHESERRAALDLVGASSELEALVGAEGGWSAEETRRLLAYGARPFGLGTNRLRAETAALVATTLLKRSLGEI